MIDNLTKMIVNLLKPDLEQMKQFGFQAVSEEEEGKIEERISQVRAEELLEAWKRLKVKGERDNTSASNSTPLLEDTKVNDELFIETGEDFDDIFKAFKHYGLKAEITDEDRRRY